MTMLCFLGLIVLCHLFKIANGVYDHKAHSQLGFFLNDCLTKKKKDNFKFS
jgi:hypothetical protein